ncbi:hypothetical protein MHBO_004257 [Bonamia ostreae]|uniref:Uncharacterized protein n=1 Tax=Bonamia ostreae TaxID=126728 RepID=A0ABV2AT26_9EUKA
MPCGELGKGLGSLSLDPTVNQVSGSAARGGEGATKALASMELTRHTQLRLWSEKPADTSSVVTFWWAKVSPDGGTYTKIDDSESQFTVKGGTKALLVRMRPFTIELENGDRLALRASADKVDGAFIESTSQKLPMVLVSDTVKELTERDQNVDYLMKHANEVEFVDAGVPISDPENYKLQIDIKTGQTKIVNI